MDDNLANIDLSFISKNKRFDYEVGKLKLNSRFVHKFRQSLPKTVFLHLPCTKIWKGTFCPKNSSILGLDGMMQYYGIKPYYMVILKYVGDATFKVQIFNEYAVEICYPFESYEYHKRVETRRDRFLFENIGLDCSEIELARIRDTLSFNANINFLTLYEYEVLKSDLDSSYRYEVLSMAACAKMKLNDKHDSLRLGFHGYTWTIALKWKKGKVYFDNNWHKFLTQAKIVPSSLCIFQQTKIERTFRIAVLSKTWMNIYATDEGYFKAIPEDVKRSWKWFKNLNKMSLKRGEVEIPRLFSLKFGNQISQKILITMTNGDEFFAQFNQGRKSISGLTEIFKKFAVADADTIFFDYIGDSSFILSLYDYHGLDRLKNISGEFKLFEDMQLSTDEEDDNTSYSSENEDSDNSIDEEQEAETNEIAVLTVNILQELNSEETNYDLYAIQPSDSTEDSDSETEDEAENERYSFTTILKRSHVDQQTHGVYLPQSMRELCRTWSKRTVVSLLWNEYQWEVEVLRSNESYRFGIGWNKFTSDMNLQAGNVLSFRYLENLNFQVIT